MNRKKLLRRTRRALLLHAKWQRSRMFEVTLNGHGLGSYANPYWKEQTLRSHPLLMALRAGGVVRFEPAGGER